MHNLHRFAFVTMTSSALWVAGCTASNDKDTTTGPLGDSGTLDVSGDAGGETTTDLDGGLTGDGGPIDGPGPGGVSAIYASTDTELWQMDPTTKAVTKIGAFVLPAGSTGSITDVAVNGDGKVWVNTTSKVYEATLPAGGTGPVTLTLKLTLPTGSRFYALGFAPAGVLETGEGLVAGDSLGDLYYIPTSSPTPTVQRLGGFGPCLAGDPAPCKSGSTWQLSGDVVFFAVGGSPRGLATLRRGTSCT